MTRILDQWPSRNYWVRLRQAAPQLAPPPPQPSPLPHRSQPPFTCTQKCFSLVISTRERRPAGTCVKPRRRRVHGTSRTHSYAAVCTKPCVQKLYSKSYRVNIVRNKHTHTQECFACGGRSEICALWTNEFLEEGGKGYGHPAYSDHTNN